MWHLLLCVFLLFSGYPSILAQLAQEQETYYVTYLIDQVSDLTVNAADEFLEHIESSLAELGFEVDFRRVQTPTETPNSQIIGHIAFRPIFDRDHVIVDTRIAISPSSAQLTTRSPLLTSARPTTLHISNPKAETHVLALLLYGLGRCDLAMARLLQLLPDNDVMFYIGNCWLVEGNYEKAIAYYDDAGLDGSTGEFMGHNLIWAYIQVGKEEKAFSILDSVINDYRLWASNSEYASFLAYRAQIYTLAFRYDDAVADIDAALELDPENPELYVKRGNIILLLYEWDRVLENYNRALELDPVYADAYFYRGILYYSILERENALADFEQYLALAPDGIHAEAAQHYRESIRLELETLGECC